PRPPLSRSTRSPSSGTDHGRSSRDALGFDPRPVGVALRLQPALPPQTPRDREGTALRCERSVRTGEPRWSLLRLGRPRHQPHAGTARGPEVSGPLRFVVQGVAEGLVFSLLLCVLGVLTLRLVS